MTVAVCVGGPYDGYTHLNFMGYRLVVGYDPEITYVAACYDDDGVLLLKYEEAA